MQSSTFSICTLGCKVNQYESERIIQDFLSYGFELVDFSDEADVYIINTCTVTNVSNHKSRQVIRRAIGRNPPALVIVTGCYVNAFPEELRELDGVDMLIKNEDKPHLAELVVGKVSPGSSRESHRVSPRPRLHTRALLKVQDGCDRFCSYCIVPYARGKPLSISRGRVLAEATRLAEAGIKEIVVTGVNLGRYGCDLPNGTNLEGLLADLARIPGLARIRLSSIEPLDITAGLITLISSNLIFCRHLHIPLQSGSDEILRAMNRNYTGEDYVGIIEEIRDKMPGVAITTDVMVGFPGETEEHFKRTKDLISRVRPRKIHVFRFSPRLGTLACSLPGRVSFDVKKRRSAELIELGEELARDFIGGFVGRRLEVLVEKLVEDNLLTGLTDNYIRACFKGPSDLVGELVSVYALRFERGRLYGEIVGQEMNHEGSNWKLETRN
ncbi:MAG: tRNA (N(6)-L-threonylcarbamoyladenosine(37)-C(2))-methylthiotransferase MtaB [Actinomycetota bacterium]|nr:tRNA (N(6)-L-threonylcarbamoyladenosine(37)-C(2))-methylthiotransferase MtaB [Actinomycetota bacterium]